MGSGIEISISYNSGPDPNSCCPDRASLLLGKIKQKILPQIVEMICILEFAAKSVFGNGFPDPYLPANLGAVGIVQGKLDLSHALLLDKGLFQSFKLDAIVREVRNYPGVLLLILDEHPFKVHVLADAPPPFQYHAENMPALALVFQPDLGLVPDKFGHVLGVGISA